MKAAPSSLKFGNRESSSPAADTYHPTGRLILLLFMMLCVFGAFGARIYYLTVLRGDYYYELSENNFLFQRPISAPRGKILTDDGAVAAQNLTYYHLRMSPFRLSQNQIRLSISRLAQILGRPEIAEKVEDVIRIRPQWKRVTLVDFLDQASANPVLERIYELPGVLVERTQVRYYPTGNLLGHITGYVGPISPEEVQDYEEHGYIRSDLVGKLGIEREYESYLRGDHGVELTIRDAFGRPRSSQTAERAHAGNDVVLTIDFGMQRLADALLASHRGAAIVMDPRNGAILALSAKPDYDPNYPTKKGADGKSTSYNKATRGAYAPGSTFKIVTASAGLLAGRKPSETVECEGAFYLEGAEKPFYCDIRSGHGSLNMIEALQASCNVYFYHWADQIGRGRMTEVASQYGFGEATGLDLPAESPGVLARPGVDKIYQGSVVQMGIGQGSMIGSTPIQLLCAYAALGNGGKRIRPHLLKEVRSASGELVYEHEAEEAGELPIDEGQRKLILEGFRRVIQEEGGTAFARNFPAKWKSAGKTGSSEVAGQKLTNGWFVAFAPANNPEICAVVLVEAEGHGGTTAAPIVRELFRQHFDPPPAGSPLAIPTEGAPHPPEEGQAPPSENLPKEEDEEVPLWAR